MRRLLSVKQLLRYLAQSIVMASGAVAAVVPGFEKQLAGIKKASGSRSEKVLISFESDANSKVGSERLSMAEVGIFKAI